MPPRNLSARAGSGLVCVRSCLVCVRSRIRSCSRPGGWALCESIAMRVCSRVGLLPSSSVLSDYILLCFVRFICYVKKKCVCSFCHLKSYYSCLFIFIFFDLHFLFFFFSFDFLTTPILIKHSGKRKLFVRSLPIKGQREERICKLATILVLLPLSSFENLILFFLFVRSFVYMQLQRRPFSLIPLRCRRRPSSASIYTCE